MTRTKRREARTREVRLVDAEAHLDRPRTKLGKGSPWSHCAGGLVVDVDQAVDLARS